MDKKTLRFQSKNNWWNRLGLIKVFINDKVQKSKKTSLGTAQRGFEILINKTVNTRFYFYKLGCKKLIELF